ncbi:hypothetical protein ABW21_db0207988 [Orbilia brochopaga]|nr:hypothetical protein ABW21_db0207988 [Drechslerella brochopaga]
MSGSGNVASGSPIGVSLVGNSIVVDKRLEITFRRTIKVPDNGQTSDLPPDLGQMALTNVTTVARRLPDAMAAKGGLLIAMHEDEAMWINFNLQDALEPASLSSDRHYAVKMFAGGVNVVSGEPEHETTASTLRRRNLLTKGESIQDYVVVPGQEWIDGIAVEGGKVLQFVAKPLGKGFTVEGQMTGAETVGGLQFEIIATKKKVTGPNEGCVHVHVTGWKKRQFSIYNFKLSQKLHVLEKLIKGADHDTPESGWVLHMGKRFLYEPGKSTLRHYGVNENDREIYVEICRDPSLSFLKDRPRAPPFCDGDIIRASVHTSPRPRERDSEAAREYAEMSAKYEVERARLETSMREMEEDRRRCREDREGVQERVTETYNPDLGLQSEELQEIRQAQRAPLTQIETITASLSSSEQETTRMMTDFHGMIEYNSIPPKRQSFGREREISYDRQYEYETISPLSHSMSGRRSRSTRRTKSALSTGSTQETLTEQAVAEESRRQEQARREAERNPELGIAAGGKIQQSIVTDKLSDDDWDKENILAFNVQILNAQDYVRITRLPAPSKPVSASEYAASGGKFFQLSEEEESFVYGDFGKVKSIGQLTGQFDDVLHIDSEVIGQSSSSTPGVCSVNQTQTYVPPGGPGVSFFKSEVAAMAATAMDFEMTESSKPGLVENVGMAPLGVFENAEKLPVPQLENAGAGELSSVQLGKKAFAQLPGAQPQFVNAEEGHVMLKEYLNGSGTAREEAILCRRTERKPFRTVRDLVSSLAKKKFATFG